MGDSKKLAVMKRTERIKVKQIKNVHGFWQRKAARPCTFLCMPGNARFQGVQVPSLSGSGKDTAEGRGITLYEGQMKYLEVKK